MLVPNRVTLTIHPLKLHYEVASSVTLSCSVTYSQSDLIDVATNVNIQWSNYSSHVLNVSVNPLTSYATLNYTISNVKLSDAGRYNCSSFINTTTDNPFILTSDTINRMSIADVFIVSKYIKIFLYYYIATILVCNEIHSNVHTNPFISYYEVGSNVTLTCSLSYNKSSFIDVNTTVYMEWTYEKSIINTTNATLDNYFFQYTVDELKLSDAGLYNCSYFIYPAVFTPYIKPSKKHFDVTNITIISKFKYFASYVLCFIVPVNSTFLVTNSLNSHYEVGNNLTLSCYVTEPNLPLIDINTTLNIKWSSHKNTTNNYTVHPYNNKFTHNLTNVSLSDAGEYSCSYYLTSATDNFYIKPSDVKAKLNIIKIKSECCLRKSNLSFFI